MLENIENLKLISSHQGTTKDYIKVENRKINAFIFRTKGVGVYICQGKEIRIVEGEMAFLPKGASYEFKKMSNDSCEYMSISFDGEVNDNRIKVFSMENFTEKHYIINHYNNLWKFGAASEKHKCYSLFYSILSYITSIENSDYATKNKAMILAPAIEYMKEHIYDTDFKSDILHTISNVSDTYFRKIFMSKFGLSPKEYIIASRLSHAKELIDTGNFTNISDLAMSVGYSDPLYFSRAFKNKYGTPPSMIK